MFIFLNFVYAAYFRIELQAKEIQSSPKEREICSISDKGILPLHASEQTWVAKRS